MAESKESKESTESGGAAAGPKGPSKAPLLIALVNTIVALVAIGLLYYSKMIYKRPEITERGERERLEKLHASPTPPATPLVVNFEPMTFNISASPTTPLPADGTNQQLQGKLHYATVGISLELRDANDRPKLDEIKPVLIDTMITILGHKHFEELTSVQGRYLLRGEIMDKVNELARQHAAGPNGGTASSVPVSEILISGVYFTQFVVQ